MATVLNWFGWHKPDVTLTQRGGLFTEDRFDEIQKLDSAAQSLLFGMIKVHLATSRHKKARENELWGSATRYLQELYRAYLLGVAALCHARATSMDGNGRA